MDVVHQKTDGCLFNPSYQELYSTIVYTPLTPLLSSFWNYQLEMLCPFHAQGDNKNQSHPLPYLIDDFLKNQTTMTQVRNTP